MVADREKSAQGLVVGGVGGVALGIIATLLLAKPAAGAMPDEKLDYLIQLLEALAQGNAAIITLLQQIAAAQEAPVVKVTVLTPWVAKEPEQIFDQAIRSAGTFNSDKMVDLTNIKRLLLKVESSLDQNVIIQPIGNIVDSLLLPTNVGPPLPCVANGNISVGLAWDDWHPFVGVTITTGVAPTTGMLKIWAVVQE
ncbi:hypothetical protein ES703_70372 [subsurface metagenome]